MRKLSFKPKYYAPNTNGIWELIWQSGESEGNIQDALKEGDRIIEEGGEIRNIPDGYELNELGPSSRSFIDAFK